MTVRARSLARWQRKVLAIGHTYDVREVLDVDYAPMDKDEHDLFDLKQCFVYSFGTKSS
jgi:hypothetical protein